MADGGWTALAYLLSEWIIRAIMLFVVTRRKRPSAPQSSRVVWLMLIFLFPWPGFLLYLVLGENRLPRRRLEQHAARLRSAAECHQTRDSDYEEAARAIDPALRVTLDMGRSLTEFPITGGNKLELLGDQREIVDRLLEDVANARDHVHLMYYIFRGDDTGRRVAEALARAVRRGVRCRVLVDAVGSWRFLDGLGGEMRRAGVEVRESQPVGFLRRRFGRFDLRNHRKIAVVDDATAYAGSQNIVDPGYGHKDLVYVDLMARIEGPAAIQLQEVFLDDWRCETGERPRTAGADPGRPGSASVQVLPSGPNFETATIHAWMVNAIHNARRRVVMTTPYFIPDESLAEAMTAAARRGVRVDLIIPERSDQVLVAWAQRAYYREMIDGGVRLYLYKPGFLHSKTMTVDEDLALVGSANFDIRSFELNFEVSLLLYGREPARMTLARQEEYLAASEPQLAETWRDKPALVQTAQNIANLFSPLL